MKGSLSSTLSWKEDGVLRESVSVAEGTKYGQRLGVVPSAD